MDPFSWGPHLWFTMLAVATNSPNNPTYVQQRQHHDFYDSLKHVLPCTECRLHYASILKQHPISPSLASRRDLIAWVVFVHNSVNERLGKPTMTVDAALVDFRRIASQDAHAKTQHAAQAASQGDANAAAQLAAKHRRQLIVAIVLTLVFLVALLGCGVGVMRYCRRIELERVGVGGVGQLDTRL